MGQSNSQQVAKGVAQGKGLGDRLEDFTTSTGIKKVVKWIAGEDCGCEERKEKLNKLLKGRRANCLKEEEYEWLAKFFGKELPQNPKTILPRFYQIYNRVFATNEKPTNCPPCFDAQCKAIETVFKNYQD